MTIPSFFPLGGLDTRQRQNETIRNLGNPWSESLLGVAQGQQQLPSRYIVGSASGLPC